MNLADVPKTAGIVHPGLNFVVTGKAGGAIGVGKAVTSADGKTYTQLAAMGTDIVGVAKYDQKKADDGFVLDDVIGVIVFGVVSVAVGAAVAAGQWVVPDASGDVVDAGVGTAALGLALSDGAVAGDIIWMLVLKQVEDLDAE